MNVILPSEDTRPVMLFCCKCGMAVHHSIDLPQPMDDLPSDAIARLAKR